MKIIEKTYNQRSASFIFGISLLLEGFVSIFTLGFYEANFRLWLLYRISDEAADAGMLAIIKDILFREPFDKRYSEWLKNQTK